MIRITLHEDQVRELVAGQVASGYARLGVDSIPYEIILADIGFGPMLYDLESAVVKAVRKPMVAMPTLPPMPVESCEPCWRDIYGAATTPAIVERDHRRLIVRAPDSLVVHRRVMIDDHVVGAVCGQLYTHAGVVAIGLEA